MGFLRLEDMRNAIVIINMNLVIMMVMMMNLLNKQPISFIELLKPYVVVERAGLEVRWKNV